jgi:putative sterol carrier protein
MEETISCEQIVKHLEEIAVLTANDHHFVRFATLNNVKIVYEFVEDQQIIPYCFILEGGNASLRQGTMDYDKCDVVIRTTPETLYKILNGQFGSREAIISGKLDIRKGPSLTKLLVLRAIFNRYRKSKLRKS